MTTATALEETVKETFAMDIRQASLDDLAAIAAIYDYEVHHGISTMDTVVRTPEAWQAWFDSHRCEAHPLLVAVDVDDVVIGWGSLSPWTDRGGHARTVEPSVYVRSDRRGHGVGRWLLGRLVDCARAAGHRVVVGRLYAENMQCRKISRANGFSIVGVVHAAGEKFGRVLDALIIERVL
ncbi:MAG: N-acetyltransferase family protein [Acidobacteriota bacterium]